MKAKILGYLLGILTYLVRRVLLFVVIVIALVGASFLIWGGFSWTAFSERLIWTGLGSGMLAGMLYFSQAAGGRTYGIPTYTAAQSSTLLDWNIEIRQKMDANFDFRFQIFLIGAFTFLAGILVDVLAR